MDLDVNKIRRLLFLILVSIALSLSGFWSARAEVACAAPEPAHSAAERELDPSDVLFKNHYTDQTKLKSDNPEDFKDKLEAEASLGQFADNPMAVARATTAIRNIKKFPGSVYLYWTDSGLTILNNTVSQGIRSTKIPSSDIEQKLPQFLNASSAETATGVNGHPRKPIVFVDEAFGSNPKSKELTIGDNYTLCVFSDDGARFLLRELKLAEHTIQYVAVDGGRNGRVLIMLDKDGTLTDYRKASLYGSFEPASIKVLSLVNNTDTEAAVGALPAENVIGVDPPTDISQIKQAFEQNPGTCVILIAHVVQDQFYFGTDRSKPISIDELKDMAQKNKCTLLPLGCRSANSGMGGFTDDVNSIHVVEHLGNALRAASVPDFLQRLADGNTQIVINKSIISGTSTATLDVRTIADLSQIAVRTPYQGEIKFFYHFIPPQPTTQNQDYGGRLTIANRIGLALLVLTILLLTIAFGLYVKQLIMGKSFHE